MRTPTLRIICVLASLLLLPALTACELKAVTVRIADFESNLVEGVRFWRLDEPSGQFAPRGTIHFSEPYVSPEGEEMVDFTVERRSGRHVVTLPARVVRDPADPDMVTLELTYGRFSAPGWFRVSSFNAAGDSELSAEQVYL